MWRGAVISGLCWGHPQVLTWVIPETLLGRTARLQPFRDEARALPLALGVSALCCVTPPKLGKAMAPFSSAKGSGCIPPDGSEGPRIGKKGHVMVLRSRITWGM